MFFFDSLVPNIYSIILSIVSFLWFGAFSVNYIREWATHPATIESIVVSTDHPTISKTADNTATFLKIKKVQQQCAFFIQYPYSHISNNVTSFAPTSGATVYKSCQEFSLFSRPPPHFS